MDPRDFALQSVTPTVVVPKFGSFEPLDAAGQRTLVAANGWWWESRRAWLYARTQIASQSEFPLPYGTVETSLELLCGAIPIAPLKQFASMARAACPLEAAAWIVWNEFSGQFAVRELETQDVSAGHIHFKRPGLANGDHLVIDIHSHGTTGAFFSATDDADDRGETKISMVIGHCDQDQTSIAARLCLNGKFIALTPIIDGGGAVTFKEMKHDLHDRAALA